MSLPFYVRGIYYDLIVQGGHQNYRYIVDATNGVYQGIFHLKNESPITDTISSIMDLKLGDVNHNAFTFRYNGFTDITKNELGLYVELNSITDTTPIFKVNQATKEITFVSKAYYTKDDGTTALIGSGGSSNITQEQLDAIFQQSKTYTDGKTWTVAKITDFTTSLNAFLSNYTFKLPYTIVRKNNPQTETTTYKRYDTVASGYNGGAWTIEQELDQDVLGITSVIRNLDSTRRIQFDRFFNVDNTQIELNIIDSGGYNKVFNITKNVADNFNTLSIKSAVDISDWTGINPVESFSVNAKHIGFYSPLTEFLNLPRSTNNNNPITDNYSLVHKLYVDTALNSYVTATSLTNTLTDYVTSTSLTNTLTDYVTSTSLTNTLNNYVTSTSLTNTLNNYVTSATFNTYVNTHTSGSSSFDTTLFSSTNTLAGFPVYYYNNIGMLTKYLPNNTTLFQEYTSFRIPFEVGFGTGYSFTDSNNYEWSFREKAGSGSSGTTPLLQFKTVSGTKSIVAPYKMQASGWTPSVSSDLTTKGSVDTALNSALPVGSIILFVQNATQGLLLPTGWLQCNGATFSSSTYPDLFLARSSTTLPNLTAPSGSYYIVKALKTSS